MSNSHQLLYSMYIFYKEKFQKVVLGGGLAEEFWSGIFSRGSGLSIRPMWLCSFKQVCREVSLRAWLVKNCIDKSFFFSSRLKGYLFLNFCASHKRSYNKENVPFVKTRHMHVFIKGIIRKMNCYCHIRFFSASS